MMHNGRLATLVAHKAQLEAELQRESQTANPDHLRMSTLKRRKLWVKEEIERATA